MFTVCDIKKRFGVTELTVLGWIHSGELKAVNVGRALGKEAPAVADHPSRDRRIRGRADGNSTHATRAAPAAVGRRDSVLCVSGNEAERREARTEMNKPQAESSVPRGAVGAETELNQTPEQGT